MPGGDGGMMPGGDGGMMPGGDGGMMPGGDGGMMPAPPGGMPPGGGGGMPPGGGGGMPPGGGGGMPPGGGGNPFGGGGGMAPGGGGNPFGGGGNPFGGGGNPFGGGGNPQNNTNTAPTLTGNFVGRIANAKLLAGPTSPFGLDLGTSESFQTASVSGGIFTASLGPSGTFSVPLISGTTTGVVAVTQPFGSGTFSGTSVLFPDNQYILYELTNQSNEKILAFAGVPTATLPTFGATFYTARDDFILGSKVLGIPTADGGNFSISSTGPNAAIYWENSLSATAQRPFAAFSGGVSGTGSSQQMAFSIFVGQVNSSASATALEGSFLGFSSGLFFSGTFETSCNCGGSLSPPFEYGFYGNSADHFILTSAKLPNSSAVSPFKRRGGIEALQTYNPAINFNATTGTLSARSEHLSSTIGSFNSQLTGWVAGVGVSVSKSSGNKTPFDFTNKLTVPSDVLIQTDPKTNKVAASFTMKKLSAGGDLFFVTLGDKDLSFGTLPDTSGSSAFLDDSHFAATVDCTTATCSNTVTFKGIPAENGAVSMVRLDGVPGLTGTYAKCSYCTWGLIVGEIETDAAFNTFERMGGFWTAGAVQDITQIPLSGTASYSGHMVAFVEHKGAGYMEHGDATFAIDFSVPTGGVLTVTNFDGGGLTGNTSGAINPASGSHVFTGTLAGTGALTGVSGTHAGSFYTNEAGNALAGVGGNLVGAGIVNGSAYRLSGVHVQTCSTGICK